MLSEPPAKIPAIPKEHHKKNTSEVKGHPRIFEIKHPHPQHTHRQQQKLAARPLALHTLRL